MTRRAVLFVDDERAILDAVERAFAAEHDIELLTATDADAAMQTLESRPVDALVSDLVMPGVDGIQLLGEVRSLFPEIRLMMITGYETESEEIKKALGEQIEVLSKPWKTKELKERIRALLDGDTQDGEARALVEFGGLAARQIERAERVRRRLQKQVPLGEVLVELGELTRESYEEIVRKRRASLGFLELLRELGYLDRAGAERYRRAREESPGTDDRALLVDRQLVTEEQYLRAISIKHDIPYQEPQIGSIDRQLIRRVSLRYLLKHQALPVEIKDGKLWVIVSDPLDRGLLLDLERMFSQPLRTLCCVGEKICEALRTIDRLEGGSETEAGTSLQYREIEDLDDEVDSGKEAVRIVDYLLVRAIQLGASDLHIEPMQTRVLVRVRVDGVMHKLTELPTDAAPRIASRIKILAGADIAEKRLHQDGKIFVKIEGREVDIRVSTYVSIYGETLVLRLLDRNKNLVEIERIGFAPRVRNLIEDVVLMASSGLVLVTGPTGSGKTTTLYSLVAHALDPSEKVITAEDPVEYVLEGITQCSVNQKTGPTFADSLRAIVRQDPDTILVGEIRDGTTAGLAVESALTGHKVYSTFHTEDAAAVIIRLLEMGVEPFLVSSTLLAVLAQRLLRRLCTQCRKETAPSRRDLKFLGVDRTYFRGVRLYEPQGCAHCGNSGYKGRLGIHELLMPNDDYRDAVLERVPAKTLRGLARELPEFLSLQEDSILKAVQGLTSLSEIVANVPRDMHCRSLATLRQIAGTTGER